MVVLVPFATVSCILFGPPSMMLCLPDLTFRFSLIEIFPSFLNFEAAKHVHHGGGDCLLHILLKVSSMILGAAASIF